MMDVRAIHSDHDYRWALAQVDPYFAHEPEVGSSDGDRFEVLLMLIKGYEDAHYPVPEADPVATLEFAIDSMGRSQAALAELLGSRSRASEILHRKRYMTLEQIRTISEAWHLPMTSLTGRYELAREYA